MKKIFLLISLLFLTTIGISQSVFAETKEKVADDVLGMNLNITTYTSEPCGIAGEGAGYCTGSGQMKRCKCTVSGSTGFITFISGIYRYVYFISLVIGVLMIVFLGIAMSISGVGSEEMKSNAKKKIFEILAGLGALGLAPFILKTVAPFFFK